MQPVYFVNASIVGDENGILTVVSPRQLDTFSEFGQSKTNINEKIREMKKRGMLSSFSGCC
jgi:hypothetical protein